MNNAVAAAPELYDRATRHLREGHWYEDAIAQLSEAIRQDPANPSYTLALGCANADRAASLAYAAMYVKFLADAQAQYPQDVKEWEAAREDPKDGQYGDPRPTPPPVLYFNTKDDLRRFRLTPTQTVARVTELGTAAIAAWKEARTLGEDAGGPGRGGLHAGLGAGTASQGVGAGRRQQVYHPDLLPRSQGVRCRHACRPRRTR